MVAIVLINLIIAPMTFCYQTVKQSNLMQLESGDSQQQCS
jgi:hypothetical protein